MAIHEKIEDTLIIVDMFDREGVLYNPEFFRAFMQSLKEQDAQNVVILSQHPIPALEKQSPLPIQFFPCAGRSQLISFMEAIADKRQKEVILYIREPNAISLNLNYMLASSDNALSCALKYSRGDKAVPVDMNPRGIIKNLGFHASRKTQADSYSYRVIFR